jgi:hypothetical protein
MNVTRHNSDLALVRRDYARTIRSDQTRVRSAQRAFDLDHVEDRHAFGDADHDAHAGIDRLEDRVTGKGWRHVDSARIRAGRRDRFFHSVEHRQAEMRGATFAWRDAAHHKRAVGDRLL